MGVLQRMSTDTLDHSASYALRVLTFFQFPTAQWKTLSITNVIERLHEEFRRRVKTQGSLPKPSDRGRGARAALRAHRQGRSACAGSMAASRSLLCSARAARWWHDASRIGARIAFGGPSLSLSESALSAGRASSYARLP